MKNRTMKNKLSNFLTILKAENIKKRGTGFYWTGVILAFLSPFLFYIVAIIQSTDEVKKGIPYNHYMNFIEGSIQPFAYFFFPLFIIISVSRITQIDHKNGGWQLMETQPAYKFSIYFSKFSTILIANLISILSFFAFSVLAAWTLTFIIPIPKIAVVELPFSLLFHITIRLFVASLLVTSIQYFISVLLSSFIWSILIGFFGLLLMTFLSPFKLTPAWYPYKILSNIAETTNGSQLDHWFLYTEYIGLIASLMVLYIGFEWYQHKQFKLAFLNNSSKTIRLLSVLILGGGLLYWMIQPNKMSNHNRTIICGKIESNETFHNIYIRNSIVNDTIAIIPIKNDTFHYELKNNILTDYYEFIIDGKYKNTLFFGAKDSIYLDTKINANEVKIDIKGTRLAENQMNPKSEYDWSMVEYSLQENEDLDKPDRIIKSIYNEWKDAISKPNKFRTIDNYIAKTDFTKRSEKLATTKYLNYWNDLVKKRAALYPNEKTIASTGIKEMQGKLPLDDESLLSNEDYFNYVRSQLVLKNKQDIDDNAKAAAEISNLKPSSFRDKLLFWQIRKSLEDATSSEERSALIATYQPQFGNQNYQTKIGFAYKTIESLGKGKIAPQFEAQTLDGKLVKLSDLKSKYVAIDVWATWCGPCKQQAPYFEKLALKYKKDKIQFLSLSADEDTKKWYIEAKTKTKSILQWHLNDKNLFGKEYSMESIPRFLLIDPSGKFVNARMPQPEEAAFEIIIRKALNLPDEE